MADNLVLNDNETTGATLATDDVAGVHYQKVKLFDGGDGGTDAIDATSGYLHTIDRASGPRQGALPNNAMVIGGRSGATIDEITTNGLGKLEVVIAQPDTLYRNIDVDLTGALVTSVGPVTLYWLHVINLSSSIRFLHVYNSLSPTVGTTTPTLTYPIPSAGNSLGAGFNLSFANGVKFSTGIYIAASTAIAATGAPSTNDVVVNAGTYEAAGSSPF